MNKGIEAGAASESASLCAPAVAICVAARPGAAELLSLPASMRERDRRITAALAEARALVRAARREARA